MLGAGVQARAEGYSHAAGYNPETNVKTTAEAYYGKAKSNTWGDASTNHYYGKAVRPGDSYSSSDRCNRQSQPQRYKTCRCPRK